MKGISRLSINKEKLHYGNICESIKEKDIKL